MRTRFSSNLPIESPPNLSTSNPKHHNCRRSKQHFILKESSVDTKADQHTMVKLLRALTEGYAEAIVVYMSINAGGVHWVTGAINLADSIFYVFDSMESETRMLMLEQQARNWTPFEMSRDVLTVGSTMRIPLLYRGEYSQWVERFMNYLEEQTDGEAMINSIKNGDQPLPSVTQVSIAGNTSTEQPPLKDKSMWSDQEKRVQKIDRLCGKFYRQRDVVPAKEEILQGL
nr:hypothetical protein [Tanacetum cinerariifolium]